MKVHEASPFDLLELQGLGETSGNPRSRFFISSSAQVQDRAGPALWGENGHLSCETCCGVATPSVFCWQSVDITTIFHHFPTSHSDCSEHRPISFSAIKAVRWNHRPSGHNLNPSSGRNRRRKASAAIEDLGVTEKRYSNQPAPPAGNGLPERKN